MKKKVMAKCEKCGEIHEAQHKGSALDVDQGDFKRIFDETSNYQIADHPSPKTGKTCNGCYEPPKKVWRVVILKRVGSGELEFTASDFDRVESEQTDGKPYCLVRYDPDGQTALVYGTKAEIEAMFTT